MEIRGWEASRILATTLTMKPLYFRPQYPLQLMHSFDLDLENTSQLHLSSDMPIKVIFTGFFTQGSDRSRRRWGRNRMNYPWLHPLFQIAVAFSVGFGKQQRTTPWTGSANDAVQNLIPNAIILIVDYVLKRLTLQWKDETERPQVLLSEIQHI